MFNSLKFWRKGRLSKGVHANLAVQTPQSSQLLDRAISTATQSSNEGNGFRYEALSDNITEIRLLEHVRDYSSFRLHRFALDNAPPYLALSYHWGDPTSKHRILINGEYLAIAENLNGALRAVYSAISKSGAPPLWNRGDSIFFWVDAICIDQTNIPEKNIQVPLMSQIYRRAKGAIGYIGTPSQGRNPHHPFLAIARRAGSSVANDPQSFGDVDSDVTEFLSSPFFLRAWITQEAVLSKEFICLYGNESHHVTFSLDLLGSLIHQVQTPGMGNPDLGLIIHNMDNAAAAILQIYSRAQLRTSFRNEPLGINVVKVLSLTRPADATDKRDKVYSILGLLKEEDQQKVAVDYSASNTVPQVYTNLARYLVTTPDCMRMLAHAGKSPNYPQLPTWVPDWSHEPRYPLDYRHYRSSGDTLPDVLLSEDGQKLHLRAMLFAKIRAVSLRVTYPRARILDGPFNQPIDNDEGILLSLEEVMYQYCRACQAEFGRLPGRGTMAEIISKTLTADRGMGDRRARPDDQRYYDAFASQYPRDGRIASPRDHLAYYPFNIVAKQFNGGRGVCYTTSGQVGLVPDDAQVGDWIALFPGAELPFVIRNIVRNEFELVGHCYVHQAMDGEMLIVMNNALQKNFAGADISVDNLFKEVVLV